MGDAQSDESEAKSKIWKNRGSMMAVSHVCGFLHESFPPTHPGKDVNTDGGGGGG